jgi:tetratricopeptide (TPR) repeat protein
MTKRFLLLSSLLPALLIFCITATVLADAPAQLRQAETFAKNGRYEQAEALYQQIVTENPGTDYALQAQKKLTIMYISIGKFEQADVGFEGLVSRFSDSAGVAKAVHDIAYQSRKRANYEKANQLYQYVLDHWPGDPQAIWSQKDIAKLNVERGDLETAQAATNKLLADFAQDGRLPEALCSLGDAYRASRKHKKACELYQHVVDNWPKHDQTVRALKNIAKSNVAVGDEEAAEAAIDKLLDDFLQHKDVPEALCSIGDGYSERRKYQSAIELYQSVADTWPQNAQAMRALKNLAKSYVALNRAEQAQAATEKLLTDFATDPSLPTAARSVADTYRELRKYDEARQLYQHIIDELPDDGGAIHAYKGLAMSNARLADDPNTEAAIEEMAAKFADSPHLPEALCRVADSYCEAASYDKAKGLYQLVLGKSPDEGSTLHARRGVAMANAGMGNDKEVQTAIDSLISDFQHRPDLPSAIFFIGAKYYDDAFPKENAGLIEEARDHFTKAIGVWERIIAELPESDHTVAQAYNFAAVCYRRIGEHDIAVAYFQTVADQYPDYKYAPYALFIIGRIYQSHMKAGRLTHSEAYQGMQQAYGNLVSRYPDSEFAGPAQRQLERFAWLNQPSQIQGEDK